MLSSRFKKRVCLILPFLIFCAFSQTVRAQFTSQEQMIAGFDSLLSAKYKPNRPGCVALVARKGEIIFHRAFGLADLELNVPMEPGMVFRIGSITKQFTAVAILQLMEQGRLSLRDDIHKFIPYYPQLEYKVTIEHLLTQTSGLVSFTSISDYWKTVSEDMSTVEAIRTFSGKPLEFVPGEKWKYSNSGYFLLGVIIENITGRSYSDYLEENFFKPLGMKDSYYGNNSKLILNRTSGYDPEGDSIVNTGYMTMRMPYSAGAIMSTAGDYFKWHRALLSGRLIKKETLEKAFSEYRLSDGNGAQYGYGWFIRKLQGSPTIEHSGSIPGYLTQEIYLPREDVLVVVFTNCTCSLPDVITGKIAALAIDKPLYYTDIPVDANRLEKYAGIYVDAAGDQRMIYPEGNLLFSQRSGSRRYRIYPFAPDQFYFKDSFMTVSFIPDESGTVNGCVLENRGVVTELRKSETPLPSRNEVPVLSETLRQYTGDYEIKPGLIFNIVSDGDRIWKLTNGAEKIFLLAESETRFFEKDFDARYEFVKDGSGKINKFILRQGTKVFEGKRIGE